jgi:universal stress protein E
VATKSRLRTLMVATGTVDASTGPLLRKALQLARRFDATLRLIHISVPTYAFVPDDLKQQTKQLDRLVDRNRRRTDIDITTTVVRDYPMADAIVRQVLKHEPDMLIVESHRHSKLSRLLLDQTDWELIRNCPCPLWLSKSARLPREMKVLAAVDPFHARAKPARLDDVILRAALRIADDKPEQVIACHAYTPPSVVTPSLTGELYWQPLSDEELRRYEATVKRTLDRRLARYRIPARNRLIVPGEPPTEIARTARTRRAGLIVMGAISRSAVTRFFIGSTAERVIDDVECDVLVVKPAAFRTPVTRRVTRPVLGYPAIASAGAATARNLHY